MTRTLGRSGIEVSAMGAGCWAIGGPFWSGTTPLGWGQVDDAESARALLRAYDLGITFYDTANVYGAGHSERVVGKALKSVRNRVILATKFNAVFDEDTRQVTGSDATPTGIRSACEASLRRLSTEWIDLYQFHDNGYPADQAGPVLETLEALVTEGKIRAYGWSTDFADRALAFSRGEHCSAIQLQLNVLDDNPDVLAVCQAHSLAAINRGPLAMGLLTGKYTSATTPSADDVRGAKSPEWMKYFEGGRPNAVWLQKTEALRAVLTMEGRTLAQGALGWLWAHDPRTIPIPGFRTVAQVEENARALDRGPLSPEQMERVDQILKA